MAAKSVVTSRKGIHLSRMNLKEFPRRSGHPTFRKRLYSEKHFQISGFDWEAKVYSNE
jgi:hypothetical protein